MTAMVSPATIAARSSAQPSFSPIAPTCLSYAPARHGDSVRGDAPEDLDAVEPDGVAGPGRRLRRHPGDDLPRLLGAEDVVFLYAVATGGHGLAPPFQHR